MKNILDQIMLRLMLATEWVKSWFAPPLSTEELFEIVGFAKEDDCTPVRSEMKLNKKHQGLL